MNSPLVTLFGREFVQNRQEKSLKTDVFRQIVVEVRRIELLSEKATAKLSPSAVRDLTFPLPSAHERAQGFSSFIMCSCGKA